MKSFGLVFCLFVQSSYLETHSHTMHLSQFQIPLSFQTEPVTSLLLLQAC